eukprot:4516893-Amphidinium_carterae.1
MCPFNPDPTKRHTGQLPHCTSPGLLQHSQVQINFVFNTSEASLLRYTTTNLYYLFWVSVLQICKTITSWAPSCMLLFCCGTTEGASHYSHDLAYHG